ncbi:uncharacterized protein LOC129976226 [Argiope bruennichi]|uniref:uncharacterized protein LOC129976226 n=1 Tax=Argiope bruennichi TaxID=94029 RepID=UPI002494815A|nr:uncharacterized protein LOC129976226 [Argiope bruennichi]
MAKKLNLVILSFSSLCFIIQGLTINPEDLDKYYKCYTYAKCFSDGPSADQIEKCFSTLKPEELKSAYQLTKNNFFHYKSDDISGAVREFCHHDDATRRYAYNQTINGILAYHKKVCGDSDKAETCSRSEKGIECLFNLLKQLRQQGKCCVDGSVQNMAFNV